MINRYDFNQAIYETARSFRKSGELCDRTNGILKRLYAAACEIDLICKIGEWFFQTSDERETWVKKHLVDLDYCDIMLKALADNTWLRTSMSYVDIANIYCNLLGKDVIITNKDII
jgi:hypothetical protein